MRNNATPSPLFATSRVLVIDDCITDRTLARQMLKKSGFTHIFAADNGTSGLDMLLTHRPDLVLLDANMPDMQGTEVVRRARDAGSDAAIILVTGLDLPHIKAAAFEAGVTDFIAKPLNLRELTARARAHLERRHMAAMLEQNYSRIRSEMQEAMMLQNILLPSEAECLALKASHGVDIAHYFHPATELGGDYLLIRAVDSQRIAILMADVAGHGISSSLYAFALHALLDSPLLRESAPDAVLSHLNSRLRHVLVGGKFATLFYGIIDTRTHTLCYSAAAAPAPLLISNTRATFLDTQGYLLGAVDQPEYSSHTVPYQPGDLLFLYSDALVESHRGSAVALDESGLARLLQSAPMLESSAILRVVLERFFSSDETTVSDDLSLIACRF